MEDLSVGWLKVCRWIGGSVEDLSVGRWLVVGGFVIRPLLKHSFTGNFQGF